MDVCVLESHGDLTPTKLSLFSTVDLINQQMDSCHLKTRAVVLHKVMRATAWQQHWSCSQVRKCRGSGVCPWYGRWILVQFIEPWSVAIIMSRSKCNNSQGRVINFNKWRRINHCTSVAICKCELWQAVISDYWMVQLHNSTWRYVLHTWNLR